MRLSEVENKVVDDFLRVEGKEILVSVVHVFGDVGKYEDFFDIELDPPARARILTANDHDLRGDLLRNMDTHIDPYYSIEWLEDRPEFAGTCSPEIYGRSYVIATGKPDDEIPQWRLAE